MLKLRVVSLLLLLAGFSQGFAATAITDLVIEGPVRVKIGYDSINKKPPSYVKMTTEGNSLTIGGVRNESNRWYDVSLSAKQYSGVKRITIKDSASLTAKGYSVKGASLISSTTGTVDLNGDLDFKSIKQSGSGKVRVHWLKGKEVDIEVSAGQLIIAGKVDIARLRASRMADINARHLTARKIWVLTENEGFVKVKPSDSMFVFTKGSSAVEAYNKPKFRSILSYGHSAVIYPDPKPRTYQLRNRKLKRELRV
jgi:hypothetical protein